MEKGRRERRKKKEEKGERKAGRKKGDNKRGKIKRKKVGRKKEKMAKENKKGKKEKEKSEKEEEEKRQDKKEEKTNNYKKIIIALVILILILTIVVLALVFKSESTKIWDKIVGNSFNYHGMTFHKTKFGKLTMYQTNLAIYRPFQNNTFYWQLMLRNDPRQLEKKIDANLTDKLTRKVYVSFDEAPLKCNSTILTAYRIGEFLDALGAYKEAAFANEETAKAAGNASYKIKNCSNAINGWSVILLKQSDKNKSYIHQEGKCYILEIANCETIETSERLFLALIDTMAKQPQTNNKENENNETSTNINN